VVTAEELRKEFYDRGEFDRCLAEVEVALVGALPNEHDELSALGGWCYYRKGEYETAQRWFEDAGQVPFAREGIMYIAAYRTKDDPLVQEIARELGDRVNVHNALVIRARDTDSIISHDEVLRSVLRFQGQEVEVANLYHNGGRFFLAKVRDQSDLVVSLGLMGAALARYGMDRNWHHRGAANFWCSRILEQLLDKRAALEAARESLYCWTQQCILDPGTERHRQQLANAHKRILELLS